MQWFNRLRRRYRYAILLTALALLLPVLADRLWPLPLDEAAPARIVVDEQGTPLWRFADKDGIWRYPVTLEQVSPHYIEALVGYEDKSFWFHPGVNPFAIFRASWQALRYGRVVSGGSTITMQVARILEPHPRTPGGKLRQIWRAFQLEWHFSKRQILTLYLNRAPYGGTLQGIGAASWSYLGKAPDNLSYSEAALLAVLPQAPGRLRPDRWPQRAQQARDKVLRRLAEQGVWPKDQVAEALEESVWLPPRQSPHLAPLLSRYLLSRSNERVIHSTLNAALQQQLETLAANWKARLPPRNSLAILVVDHTTMQVKGWVGSVDIQDKSRFGHVDMVSATRSPGSLLKPFVYGLALDEGLIHPASLLQDVPRRFDDYRPGNFDTGFHGPVSMGDALIRSLNLPAVQVLEAYGPKRFAGQLQDAGLPLRLPRGAEPNLSLILGGAGARLDNLVAAYSAFTRQGKAGKLRLVAQDTLEERRLLSPGAAWIIRRILGGELQPPGNNAVSSLAPVAWKTGTSYGYRDAWAVGMNSRYLIGVWTGRPDGTPTAGQFGQGSALPLFNQVNHLLQATSGLQQLYIPRDPKPESVTVGEICWPGGQALAAGDQNCRRRLQTWLLEGGQPPTLESRGQESLQGIRQKIWLNREGKRVAADCPDATPAEVALWPLALEPWLAPAERRGQRLPAISDQCPPLQQASLPPLLLYGLREGEVIKRLPGQRQVTLQLTTQGGEQGARYWFLNGESLADRQAGLNLSLRHAGDYQLLVMDEAGQIASVNFTLR